MNAAIQKARAEFVCERCWRIFEDGARARCPDCDGESPAVGWTPMPFRYRKRYLFERQLGRGGMGAVFAATVVDDLGPDEPSSVAVKVIQQRAGASPQVQRAIGERFKNEMRAAGFLDQSSRFIRVLGFDSAHLVMERIEWPTLLAMRAEGETFAPVEVARLGAEILDAVAEMHWHGIVHRDIKPENLFVQRKGERFHVKIADLGVCLVLRKDTVGGTSPPSRTPTRVGTPNYMSPEQMDDADRVGTASDLHAVGSLLWELVTGRVPFPLSPEAGTDEERVRRRRASLRLRPPRPDSMPAGLYAVLAGALASNPGERPADAQRFGAALREFVACWERETREAHERARSRIGEIQGQLRRLRVQIQPLRSLEAKLAEIDEGLRMHEGRLAIVGTATIVQTHADLDQISGQLKTCVEQADQLLQRVAPRAFEAPGTISSPASFPLAPPTLPPAVAAPVTAPEPPTKVPRDTLATVGVIAAGSGLFLGLALAHAFAR